MQNPHLLSVFQESYRLQSDIGVPIPIALLIKPPGRQNNTLLVIRNRERYELSVVKKTRQVVYNRDQ